MNKVRNDQKAEVFANFQYEGVLTGDCPYGSGHINDTFLLTFSLPGTGEKKIILQRMNSRYLPTRQN